MLVLSILSYRVIVKINTHKLMYTNICTYGWSAFLSNASRLVACGSNEKGMPYGNLTYYLFLLALILERTSENITSQFIRMTLKIKDIGNRKVQYFQS